MVQITILFKIIGTVLGYLSNNHLFIRITQVILITVLLRLIKSHTILIRFLKTSFSTLLFSVLIIGCNSNLNPNRGNELTQVNSENRLGTEKFHPTNFQDTLNTSTSLTLASWNIRHLGRTKTDENIHQIATILREFDIVAIQEVVAKDPAGAQAVTKIADELNRMGSKWDYQISDPTKSPLVYMSERYAFLWKTSR